MLLLYYDGFCVKYCIGYNMKDLVHQGCLDGFGHTPKTLQVLQAQSTKDSAITSFSSRPFSCATINIHANRLRLSFIYVFSSETLDFAFTFMEEKVLPAGRLCLSNILASINKTFLHRPPANKQKIYPT